MKECNRKHQSHQRRNAAASLPPRSGLPFPFDNHRAESIPLALPALTHCRYPFPLCHRFLSSAQESHHCAESTFLVAAFAATTTEKSPVNKAR